MMIEQFHLGDWERTKKLLEYRFADFDAHAKLSFQPGSTNQFVFGDLMLRRLTGAERGAKAALVCYVLFSTFVPAVAKMLKDSEPIGV